MYKITCPNDGVSFDPDNINISEIQRDARYCGFRVAIKGKIDTARITVQLDIGFGTSVIPGPIEISYPKLLDFDAPQLLGSSLECAIADKFEAMVSRGDANTRLKDFYDIFIITKNSSFIFDDVCRAISETFHYYETGVPLSPPICISDDFYQRKQTQNNWNNFLKRSRLDPNLELSNAIGQIVAFTMPVCEFINGQGKRHQSWSHEKRWH